MSFLTQRCSQLLVPGLVALTFHPPKGVRPKIQHGPFATTPAPLSMFATTGQGLRPNAGNMSEAGCERCF
eukprot:757136-Hanusia_phi.AAC.2